MQSASSRRLHYEGIRLGSFGRVKEASEGGITQALTSGVRRVGGGEGLCGGGEAAVILVHGAEGVRGVVGLGGVAPGLARLVLHDGAELQLQAAQGFTGRHHCQGPAQDHGSASI